MNKELILERIQALCDEKNITPTAAFTESGVGKNFKSNFKTANPSEGKLTMLANYFGVSVAYLKGETDQKEKPAAGGELTEHEKKIIDAYRNHPEMQPTVDRVLGIQKEGQVLLWAAAQSEDNHAPKVIYMSKERWDKIQSAPDTDDPLL